MLLESLSPHAANEHVVCGLLNLIRFVDTAESKVIPFGMFRIIEMDEYDFAVLVRNDALRKRIDAAKCCRWDLVV